MVSTTACPCIPKSCSKGAEVVHLCLIDNIFVLPGVTVVLRQVLMSVGAGP